MTIFADSLRNLFARIGTPQDKAEQSEYVFTPLNRQQIVSSYRGSWLPRKIVDVPAKDATRKWRAWSASKDQITKIEKEERRLDLRAKVERAMRLGRLTGGAAIYIGTRGTDVQKELDPESVRSDESLYLAVLSRDRVTPTEIDNDVASPTFGTPKSYTLQMSDAGRVEQVHPSRLALFFGDEPLDNTMLGMDGWGDSSLQTVYRAAMQHDSTMAIVSSLVFEAKIDVVKIPGLMKGMGDKNYEKKVTDRFALANVLKGTNSMTLLDAAEEWEQKSVSFAAIPDIIDRFMTVVSGAADIPSTRLFGISPAGMNSTGESDLRNYYDHVQSIQQNDLNRSLSVLDECLLRSALGSRPEEIFHTWRSLWQTTEKERIENFGKIATGVKTLADMKILPEQTLVNAAVNMLIESETMPGLEAAVEEFGIEKSEEELEIESEMRQVALAKPVGEKPEDDETKKKPPVKDSTPRSLYVRRQVRNASAIRAWAASQGLVDLMPAEEMHVTIAYSTRPFDWMQIGESYEEEIVITGGPRVVEVFDGGAVVLQIPCRSLHWRHSEIVSAGASWDHPEYAPHITLTRAQQTVDPVAIQPYTGKIVLGPEIFEEIKR